MAGWGWMWVGYLSMNKVGALLSLTVRSTLSAFMETLCLSMRYLQLLASLQGKLFPIMLGMVFFKKSLLSYSLFRFVPGVGSSSALCRGSSVETPCSEPGKLWRHWDTDTWGSLFASGCLPFGLSPVPTFFLMSYRKPLDWKLIHLNDSNSLWQKA